MYDANDTGAQVSWCRARLWVDAPDVRRIVNVMVALIALALTLPLWLIISMAIKATSPGPVFYTQVRVGLDRRASAPRCVDLRPDDPRRRTDIGGRPFRIYKFRTMAVDAERLTGEVWSSDGDPRVTTVGRFLRRSRLDELPQLLNVIRGDMNVVGPRPERPTIFAALAHELPGYARRQRTRPGITGFAQVHLEYDATVEDVAAKLRYDLAYLESQSVGTDLRIMARTVPVLLFRSRLLHHAPPSGAPVLRG